MNERDAVDLIRDAIPRSGGTWADLGAGEGAFTRALVELLGGDGRVYAVDRDAASIAALGRWANGATAGVIPVLADFTRPFALPGLATSPLDGLLLANALHFVREADVVLGALAARLRPGGRIVIVEYEREIASRWVPYPIPVSRLGTLAASAGLSPPVVTATRPSAFGGKLYVAVAERPAAAS